MTVPLVPLPGGQLLAGRAQHPVPHGHDESTLLGHTNEFARGYQPTLRVLPADQGLGTHHAAVQVELRLVVQHKLPRREGHLQVGLQLRAHADRDLHLRVEEAQRVAPLRLDLVHGDVGLLEQVHRGLQAAAHQRGADAGRAVVGVPAQRIGHVEPAQDRLAHPPRLGGRLLAAGGQLVQHDHELVAAQARHRVLAPHAGLQALGHLLQQQVAHFVPHGVVEGLEVVQVQEQQGAVLAAAHAGRDELLHAVHEQAAVGQVGQRVVEGQALDLGAGTSQRGHVVVGDDQPALGRAALGDLDGAAVRQRVLQRFVRLCQQAHPHLQPARALLVGD